jgi:hypothetical protein
MYFYFIKTLKKAMEAYTSHPVFEQSSTKYFDKLRVIFRKKFKTIKHSEAETTKHAHNPN